MTEREIKKQSELFTLSKAVRFTNAEGLLQALERIRALDPKGEHPLQYHHVPPSRNGLPGLLLTKSSYDRLVEALIGTDIEYKEVRAIRVSALPIKQQRVIRG